MIIQAIQAENLFKYKKLSLTGLPPAGRILLSGPNESGKTAIVETICLGLFGRTASLEAMQLAKAIKWGETHATLMVTFLGADGHSYTVSRYLDSTGRSQASLSQTGESEPMAKGVEAVDQAVMGLAGFDFKHYMETLFLTQNRSDGAAREETIQSLAGVTDLDGLANTFFTEIETSQAEIEQSDRQMESVQAQLAELNVQPETLGTLERERNEAMERVVAIGQDMDRWQLFASEMQEAAHTIESSTHRLLQCDLESTLESWQGRVKVLETALHKMGEVCQTHHVEMDAVPGVGLRGAMDKLKERLASAADLMEQVANHRYQLAVWLGEIPSKEESDTLHRAQAQRQGVLEWDTKRRQRAGTLIWVTLLLALLIGAVGAVLQLQADSDLAKMAVSLLKMAYPAWDATLLPILFGGGVCFLLLAVNGAGRSFRLRKKIVEHERILDELDERARSVRNLIQSMDAAAKESFSRQVGLLIPLLETEAWMATWNEWANAEGLVLLDAQAQNKFLATLQSHLEAFQKEMATDTAEITEQRTISQQTQQQLTETIAQLEAEIEQEQARRAQDAAWRTHCATWEAERIHQTHYIAVRRIACGLLKGACQGLSTRFNQELRRFIARAAPLFTQGRYQHLRIDEALQVSVFSTAKNDFVDFNEISTGVRYQLLLAVRMALAQALTARANRMQQFIVLDEPFVFFDRQRIRESLDALLHVSEQITQIWVIAQEYEANLASAGDLHLFCVADEDSLVVHQG